MAGAPQSDKITVGFYTSQADIGDSGVGIYQKNLATAFNKLNHSDIKFRYIHYEDSDMDIYKENRDIVIPQPHLVKIAGDSDDICLRHHRNYISELYLNNYNIDVLHIQSIPYKRPFWSISNDTKVVSTIHSPWDIVTDRPWESNSVSEKIKSDILKRTIYKILAYKIDAIVTVSEYMKSMLVKSFNINPEKIHVIHNAPDKSGYDPIQQSSVQNIPPEYILHVSHLNERKNPEGVLRGFEIAKRYHDITAELVIAGGGWTEGLIDRYIRKSSVKEDIHIQGYVSRSKLSLLYKCASTFLLPSYSESCSLAQLESMSCGTPVVTTDSGGMPEVGRDANLYVSSPENYREISQKIVDSLREEEHLGKKAKDRASEFSWVKNAKELIKIYRSIIK